jgi:ankyrin repeat protein
MKTIFLALCLCLSAATCAAQEKTEVSADEQLIACVKDGDTGCVARALSAGASVNAVDERGIAALALAAEGTSEGVARLLLNSGADVDGKDAGGTIPLCRAASFGREETVRTLLAAGAKINVECDGDHGGTPLTGALMSVTLMDVPGGDVTGEGEKTRRAFKGSRESYLAIARLLVERGADVNAVAKCDVGETALMYAAMSANVELVEFLLAHGAEVNNGGSVLAMMRAEGYEKEKAKWLSMPALAKEQSAMLAWFERTKAEREKIRQLLRAAGAKEPANDGEEPAAETFEEVADEIFTSAILKSDAEDLERLIKAYAAHPQGVKVLAEALRTALIYSRTELVKLLLARGADPNAADDDGQTAREVTEFLKARGAQSGKQN